MTAEDVEEEVAGTGMPKLTAGTVVQAVVGLTIAVLVIVFGLPWIAHTTWDEIFHALSRVGPLVCLELFGMVVFGLWFYTFTLTGSLPGLSHVRALIMNVSGSAVGNLLPGGGAAGVAATYLMARSWGFARREISTSIIVSGVWNVLARVALPLLGIAALSLSDNALPAAVRRAAWWAGVSGLLLLAVFIAILVSPRLTERTGRWLDRVVAPRVARFRRGDHKGQVPAIGALMTDQRGRIASVTRTGWFPMTMGLVGFMGVYFLLFWRTLNAVGVNLPWINLFAAYAIGRLLTAVGVTPGGLGITEAGTLAVLAAWGAPPAPAAAGVLLFAIFTHVLELPLGALGWLAWWMSPKETPPDAVKREVEQAQAELASRDELVEHPSEPRDDDPDPEGEQRAGQP